MSLSQEIGNLPASKWVKNIIIDGEEKEMFVMSRDDISDFIGEIYTETEWYPDYVAKGEAKESRQTRQDFIRGWMAHEMFYKK